MQITETETSRGTLMFSLDAELLRRLDEALALLAKLAQPPPPKPAHIALGIPTVTRQGKIMNFELANDTVASIAIHTVDAAGDVVPAPAGDTFTAVSSDPAKMTAIIGAMPAPSPLAGAVAVILTPLVKLAPGLTVTMSDSGGLTTDVQNVDIVADLTPKAIMLDLAEVALTPQPVPAA